MQPRLRVTGSPQRNSAPSSSPFNFLGGTGQLEVFEDDVIRAANSARGQGIGEREINNTLQTYLQQRAAQTQSRRQQQSQQPEEKRNGWLDFLLPTAGGAGGAAGGATLGATLGSVVPGIGTAIGGGLGAILGGALGSGGAQIANNKIQGKNFKDRLGSETLFGAAGGVGKAFSLAKGASKGAKALSMADDVSRVASGGDDVARFTGSVDDLFDVGKTDITQVGKVAKQGKRLRANARGLNTTQGRNAFSDASSRFGASDVLSDAGLKGSPRKQFEEIGNVISDYGKKAQVILKDVKGVENSANIVDDIIKKTALSPNASDAAYKKSIENATNLITNVAGKRGGQLTASQIHTVKSRLGDKLGRAFAKLGSSNKVLTAGEEGLLDAWEALDDSIIRLAPQAKQLTKAQSIMMKAIPGLDAKASKGIGVPFTSGLNLTTPSRLLDSVQDNAGRILETVGGTGQAKMSPALNNLLKGATQQGLPRALFSDFATQQGMQQPDELGGLFISPEDQSAIEQITAAGINDPNQIAQILQANGLGGELTPQDIAQTVGGFSPDIASSLSQGGAIFDDAGALSQSSVGAGLMKAGFTPETFGELVPREAIIQAMQEDLVNTGGENMNTLITFYDFANQTGEFAPPEVSGAGGLELNNTAITAISDTQAGLDQLTSLAQTFEQSDANAPVIGRLRGLNPFDTDAQRFESELRLTKQIIGKALEGGVLRKEDEAKYSAIMPNRGDTDESALSKIDFIRRDIQNKLDIYIANQQRYSGGGGDANINSSSLSGLEALGL